jgi:hypothetical protein
LVRRRIRRCRKHQQAAGHQRDRQRQSLNVLGHDLPPSITRASLLAGSNVASVAGEPVEAPGDDRCDRPDSMSATRWKPGRRFLGDRYVRAALPVSTSATAYRSLATPPTPLSGPWPCHPAPQLALVQE